MKDHTKEADFEEDAGCQEEKLAKKEGSSFAAEIPEESCEDCGSDFPEGAAFGVIEIAPDALSELMKTLLGTEGLGTFKINRRRFFDETLNPLTAPEGGLPFGHVSSSEEDLLREALSTEGLGTARSFGCDHGCGFKSPAPLMQGGYAPRSPQLIPQTECYSDTDALPKELGEKIEDSTAVIGKGKLLFLQSMHPLSVHNVHNLKGYLSINPENGEPNLLVEGEIVLTLRGLEPKAAELIKELIKLDPKIKGAKKKLKELFGEYQEIEGELKAALAKEGVKRSGNYWAFKRKARSKGSYLGACPRKQVSVKHCHHREGGGALGDP